MSRQLECESQVKRTEKVSRSGETSQRSQEVKQALEGLLQEFMVEIRAGLRDVKRDISLELDRGRRRMAASLDDTGRSLEAASPVNLRSRAETYSGGTSPTAAFWHRVGAIKNAMEQDSRQEAARRRSLGGW